MSTASLIAPRPLRMGLALVFDLAALAIYMPIVVMAVFSVNSGRYQTLPFREPTLEWYAQLAADT